MCRLSACVLFIWAVTTFLAQGGSAQISALSDYRKLLAAQVQGTNEVAELDKRGFAKCSAERLGATNSLADDLIRIENAAFSSTGDGRQWFLLDVRNIGTNIIQGLALVVEYIDDHGSVIETVAVAASYGNRSYSWKLPFPIEEFGRWEHPVSPGFNAIVSGSEGAVVPRRCPVGFRLTYLAVLFSDGSTRSFATPQWQTAAIPRRIAPIPAGYSELNTGLSGSACAQLTIDAEGRVTRMNSIGTADHRLFALLSKWMQNDWMFYPATVSGAPQESVIDMAFFVGLDRITDLPDVECSDKAVAVIRLVNDFGEPTRRKRTVYYGSLIENSALE